MMDYKAENRAIDGFKALERGGHFVRLANIFADALFDITRARQRQQTKQQWQPFRVNNCGSNCGCRQR